ncbi:MAG: VTT domain-containing protein [Pseudomonadota bacterium]
MRYSKIGLAVVVIAILFGLSQVLPIRSWLFALYDWTKVNPGMSAVAFVSLYSAWLVLVLPGVFLVIAAGFLYGFVNGLALILVGHVIGSTLAFLISRNLTKSFVEKRLGSSVKLEAIDGAIRESAFTIVFLARLSMVLPYSLLNYAFGLTSVGLRDYITASLLGMVPPFVLFVFLGTTADDLASIVNGEVGLDDHAWIVAVFGVVMIIVIIAYIVRKAKVALNSKLEQYEHPANTVENR